MALKKSVICYLEGLLLLLLCMIMKDLRDYQPKKILVRMPNWIGDLVMATPVLEDLKAAYPSAEITAMCRSPLAELLKYNPFLDEIYSFEKGPGIFSRRDSQRSVVRKLHTGSYDLGILLTNSLSSAWCLWQGNVKYRIGYRGDGRTSLLTHPIHFSPHEEHQVITYKRLLEPLGITISDTKPSLALLGEEVRNAYQTLGRYGIDEAQIIVGINPGAAYGSAKCWLPERFQEVMSSLLESHPYAVIVLFGDHGTLEVVTQIARKFPTRVINLAGQTSLRELIALIKICHVFLTNDSGPMHIADAVGTPLLALFGSTNPFATGPYIQKNILRKEVSCSPCYKRVCPIDFRCMKGIESQQVYAQLVQLLGVDAHV